ncbi:hypothetical protein M2267_000548 [Ensifer sp. KUDG1]
MEAGLKAIDINRIALVLGAVAIVAIAASANYRVEISATRLTFEKNTVTSEPHLAP